MNKILERLNKLRAEMSKSGFDWYLMTSDDYHSSEYVSDHFKTREYYTGFTGDNAVLLLDKDNAYMWTDGRFFIQAEKELKDTTITLMKSGEEGVPTLTEFIRENVKTGETLVVDARTINAKLGKRIEEILSENGAKLKGDTDLAGDLWTDRPAPPSGDVFDLPVEYSGESAGSKLTRVREEFGKKNASGLILSKLDDIAWITNLRGSDILHNPVFLSYLIIDKRDAVLFVQDYLLNKEPVAGLKAEGFTVMPYDSFFDFLATYRCEGKILVEKSVVSYEVLEKASLNNELIDSINPTTSLKAVKNETEIKNLKEINILDSVCVIKFMYWLKNVADLEKISELDCAAKIDGLRSEVEGFKDLSFATIAGYGANAAMMHYEATPENFSYLKPEGMMLVDSGGQYLKGTTDVTRTFIVGPISDDMKLHFSKVAAGMLALADAKFLYGCTGRNLDILAREPLWELGIDYKCGTGHGVGYFLNVHEGPHGIRWKYSKDVEEAVFEEGMTVSDEPGVYVEGSHGIRTENVILCKRSVKTSDGQFMEFEHLTWVPIDRDGIDVNCLEPKDIERINKYHKETYEKTSRFLSEEERKWLLEQTKPL